MNRYEDEIGYILTDFKKGTLNYQEAIIKIENLTLECLGFGLALSGRIREVEDFYRCKLEQAQK